MSAPDVATAGLVALGAMVGAPTRYLVSTRLTSRGHEPWLGTLLVNSVGSLILGLAAGLTARGVVGGWVLPLVGVGFCGALTTFSTFALEVAMGVRERSWAELSRIIVVTMALCIALVSLGWWLGSLA